MLLIAVRRPLYITTGTLLTLVALAIAACSGSGTGSPLSGSAAPGGNGTSIAGPNGTAIGALPPTVTPTTSVASPGAGEGGAAEFCANPPDVESALPTSIPSYPNAKMRISKTSGGSGLFALCTGDPISSVQGFYLAQLPVKGWRQIVHNAILQVQQIQASKGSGFLTITIETDGQLSHTTDIVIQTSGVS
jgi:hypothetical protein